MQHAIITDDFTLLTGLVFLSREEGMQGLYSVYCLLLFVLDVADWMGGRMADVVCGQEVEHHWAV